MTGMPVRVRPEEAYSSFCSVDVRHQFCAGPDHAFAGLVFTPGAATGSRLREWGVLFRQRRDGFDLICDSGRWNALEALVAAIAASAPGGLPANLADSLLGPPLLFFAALADPLFLNFTDLPVDHSIGAPTLWLSNRDAAADGPDSYRLTVDWKGLPDPPAGPPPSSASPSDILSSDFRIEGGTWAATGRDMLLGTEELARLRDPVAHRPFAVLAIFPSGAGEGAEPVRIGPQGSSVRQVRYAIPFAARASYWRYVVACRSGELAGEDYAVVDPVTEEPSGFEPGPPVTLPDGRTAITLVSPELRFTARRPTAQLALQRLSGTPQRRRIVIPRLPAPGPDTPVASTAPGKLYSDIYVFV